MGCDMHAIAEMKNTDGKWEMVAEYDVERHYDFFANFAPCGRSESIKPISAARGWPADLSLGGRRLKAYWHPDGHSASYLTLPEIEAHRFVDRDGQPMGLPGWLSSLLNGVDGTLDVRPIVETEIRLVFWFDN